MMLTSVAPDRSEGVVDSSVALPLFLDGQQSE